MEPAAATARRSGTTKGGRQEVAIGATGEAVVGRARERMMPRMRWGDESREPRPPLAAREGDLGVRGAVGVGGASSPLSSAHERAGDGPALAAVSPRRSGKSSRLLRGSGVRGAGPGAVGAGGGGGESGGGSDGGRVGCSSPLERLASRPGGRDGLGGCSWCSGGGASGSIGLGLGLGGS